MQTYPTREQQRPPAQDAEAHRIAPIGTADVVAPQSQTAVGMLLRRASSAAPIGSQRGLREFFDGLLGNRLGVAIGLAFALSDWHPAPFCLTSAADEAALARQEMKSSGPPPLVVEKEAPLLLEDVVVDTMSPVAKKTMAQNQACFVCHENYRAEPLVGWHVDAGIGCTKCHGESDAHKNDENNVTPPDIIYPPGAVRGSCRYCHPWHHAQPQKLLATYLERFSEKPRPETVLCTHCHGEHQLAVRSVVWDKATKKLLFKKAKLTNSPPAGSSQ